MFMHFAMFCIYFVHKKLKLATVESSHEALFLLWLYDKLNAE